MLNRRGLLMAFGAALVAAAPAAGQRFDPRGSLNADDPRGRDRGGDRLPIGRLRASVRRQFPGCDIINDQVFSDRDGQPVAYRARIVTRDGRLLNVSVDPRTGRITRVD